MPIQRMPTQFDQFIARPELYDLNAPALIHSLPSAMELPDDGPHVDRPVRCPLYPRRQSMFGAHGHQRPGRFAVIPPRSSSSDHMPDSAHPRDRLAPSSVPGWTRALAESRGRCSSRTARSSPPRAARRVMPEARCSALRAAAEIPPREVSGSLRVLLAPRPAPSSIVSLATLHVLAPRCVCIHRRTPGRHRQELAPSERSA